MSQGKFIQIKGIQLAALGELDKIVVDDRQFFAFFGPNAEVQSLKKLV